MLAGGGGACHARPLVLTAIAAVSALYWLAMAIALAKTLNGVQPVGPPAVRASWPTLSLVVPARDEAADIERALRSKLDVSYPALEVVFINDRSSDETGQVAERLATQDTRLKLVHVTELPTGWLGKVHAMQRGLEKSTGEWVLFTDADVVLAPGTLERVIAQAEREGLDHVTVLPMLTGRTPILVAALGAFFRAVVAGGRLWAVSNPNSTAAAGVGAFNLVRRTALDRTPGLEWLKLEIGDDMALGVMLKRFGARSRVLIGQGTIELAFYPSFWAMARAVEKNGAAAPLPVLVFGNLAVLAAECGFIVGPAPLAFSVGVIAALVSGRLARWLGLPWWPTVFPAFGMALLGGAMIRSGVLATVRGGVRWRDTFYTLKEIRAGHRLGALPSTKDGGERPA